MRRESLSRLTNICRNSIDLLAELRPAKKRGRSHQTSAVARRGTALCRRPELKATAADLRIQPVGQEGRSFPGSRR